MSLSEENGNSRKEKCLKLTLKYCPVNMQMIFSFCKSYIKKNRSIIEFTFQIQKGNHTYFIETIPRFTTDDFQSMSLYGLQQLALEVAIML